MVYISLLHFSFSIYEGYIINLAPMPLTKVWTKSKRLSFSKWPPTGIIQQKGQAAPVYGPGHITGMHCSVPFQTLWGASAYFLNPDCRLHGKYNEEHPCVI